MSLPPTDQVIAIAPDEAHVWVVDPAELHEMDILSIYQALLSPEERARMQRFYFDRDRHAFLVAHCLARLALTWCAPTIPPSKWVFELNPHGRPEIISPKTGLGLRFNISHTYGLIACLVTTAIDCGIDVEVTDRATDLAGLGRSVFAPSEFMSMSTLPADERPGQFFRYWTLKEAYAKARGLGMLLPFNRYSFELCMHGIQISIDPTLNDNGADWQFEQWPATKRHLLAIALRRGRGPNYRIVRYTTMPDLRLLELERNPTAPD